MDSDQFPAAPLTTGGLKAYFEHFGKTTENTQVNIVHFVNRIEDLERWREHWLIEEIEQAKLALAAQLKPVVGISLYTWNAAEFIALIHFLKASLPELTVLVGGPHVQQAEDYLGIDPIDAIVLGEGEITFQQFLDTESADDWQTVPGLAFLRDGKIIKTASRERMKDLDQLPSALDVIELTDAQGKPLYDCIAYETSRGCPYKCSFCEWGTGAIGTKMYQFSVARIRDDWERIVNAGIRNIWLTDSNFGALKEDLDKAKALCELKRRTGLPATFATSWSKKHNPRVQEIVLMMHEHNLLPHYHLALQTLTPLALELSHRTNMGANKYEPIAKQMAKEGVPIACELIWGLPGDNLASFEMNLDRLFAVFPTLNIFGYTLLPGTEFYEKREEFQIKTLPVAGYGKAKGEYVIGCHTFPIAEGLEGYYLVTAHLLLNRGYITPLTLRYLAMTGTVPVSALMREMLSQLLLTFQNSFLSVDRDDKMQIYENRALIYQQVLADVPLVFEIFRKTISAWLSQHQAPLAVLDQTLHILELDQAFCPRDGYSRQEIMHFNFDAMATYKSLESMELPPIATFWQRQQHINVFHPGGVGSVVKDPDGGVWIHGEIVAEVENATPIMFTELREEMTLPN